MFLLLILLLVLAPFAVSAQTLQFDSENHESSDGYLSITWNEYSGANSYRIAVTRGDGSTWSEHRTEVNSLFLSGLPNGEYRAVVQAMDEADRALATSASTVIRVAHHPRSLTITLFSIGAVVFVAIVFFIVRGRRYRVGESADA